MLDTQLQNNSMRSIWLRLIGRDAHARARLRKSYREGDPLDPEAATESTLIAPEQLLPHLPLIGTAVIFLFVVTKVTIIAGGDMNTAFALVDRAGPFQVLAGTFISISDDLAYGITAGLIAYSARNDLSLKERAVVNLVTLVFLTWLSFIVWFPIFVWLLATFAAVRSIRRKEGRDKLSFWPFFFEETWRFVSRLGRLIGLNEKSWRAIDLLVVYFSCVVLMPLLPQAFDDRPWIPAEIVTLRGNVEHVGYVISQDDRWVVILLEEERRVITLASRDVIDRTICSPDGEGGRPERTIWRLFRTLEDKYDPCPNDSATRQPTEDEAGSE